jgi:hypothetical protein
MPNEKITPEEIGKEMDRILQERPIELTEMLRQMMDRVHEGLPPLTHDRFIWRA